MLDYKPREELIALIQRQESELAKSHDEIEALKAARQPLTDSFVVKPVAGELPPLPEPIFKRGRSYGFMKVDAWDEEMVRAYGDKRAEHAFSVTAEFIELPFLQPVQQPAAVAGQEPVQWPNGCNRTVPSALRYLARNPRPSGGEEHYNGMHLLQLAHEIEQMAKQPLYTAPVPAASVQGDDYEDCPACKGSSVQGEVRGIRCSKCKGTATAPVSQPDSGRDAALAADEERQSEAHKLARILFGMVEGDGRVEGVNIYADGYSAPDGDVFVLRAAELLIEQAAESKELTRYVEHFALAAHPANGAQAGDALNAIEPDAVLLDFLDNNLKLTMGWRLGIAPAGNVSVQSIIACKTTIREAIHAAIAAKHAATLTAEPQKKEG